MSKSKDLKIARQKALEASIKVAYALKENLAYREYAVDDLLNACIENKRFDLAEHVLKMYPSNEAIDNLAVEGFKNLWRENAIELIKAGIASKKVLSSLVSSEKLLKNGII